MRFVHYDVPVSIGDREGLVDVECRYAEGIIIRLMKDIDRLVATLAEITGDEGLPEHAYHITRFATSDAICPLTGEDEDHVHIVSSTGGIQCLT